MGRRNEITEKFEFGPFSDKQIILLTWYKDYSPYKDKKIIICDGAVRSGKTLAVIVSFLAWSLGNFKKKNFILVGTSKGALERNVIDEMFKVLNTLGIWYESHIGDSKKPHIIIGKEQRNKYFLFGADNKKSFKALRGFTVAGSFLDEVSLFPENYLEEVKGRQVSILGSKIWVTTNPDNPYHWLKKEYIDKAEEKGVFHLKFLLEDNLNLPQENIIDIKNTFTGVFYQRMILGEWVMAKGIIFSTFDEKKHVADLKNEKFTSYVVSCDYGLTGATVFLLFGIKDNKAYLIREYYYSSKEFEEAGDISNQKAENELVADFTSFLGGIKPAAIIVDSAAKSFITALRKRKYRVTNSIKDVEPGISYTLSCIKDNCLLVDKDCQNTIREFMSYIWDSSSADKGIDKPVKQNDHCMDAIRYFFYTYFRSLGIKRIFNKPKGW